MRLERLAIRLGMRIGANARRDEPPLLGTPMLPLDATKRAGLRHGFAHVADVQGPVHYLDLPGRGDKTLVAVHGLGNGNNFAAIERSLTEFGRLIVPDLPGFGHSPLHGRTPSVQQLQGIINGFLGKVAPQPAYLVGHSMGGLISIMQAALHPETVRGLVLIDPAVPLTRDLRAMAGFVRAWLRICSDAAGLGLKARWNRASVSDDELANLMVRSYVHLCSADTNNLPQHLYDMEMELQKKLVGLPEAHQTFLFACFSTIAMMLNPKLVDGFIQRINCPVLVIWGKEDVVVPVSAGERVHALRPDWRFHVIDDAGHAPMLQRADRVTRVARSWLDQQP